MNDYMKAMLYKTPSAIPVSVSILPATWMKYGDALAEIVEKYPVIFNNFDRRKMDYAAKPPSYNAGSFTDAWGCKWENIIDGYESIVTGHPLKTREDIHKLKIPDKDIGFPHGFMYLRLTDLRGFEEFMMDIGDEAPEVDILIDKVLQYNIRQMKNLLASNPGTVLYFGDDLGMQHSLPISPAKWRKYMKPCYKRLYDLVHQTDRYVYMHTDGCIYEIIPDLIECGVNILNPQIGANGLDNLERTCKGKVCINLDLDRQQFPYFTAEQIDEHIHEAVERLGLPEGGLMLTAECAADIPLQNIEAICTALVKYRTYFQCS
jgi:uroporphyrinogen decarboxylase